MIKLKTLLTEALDDLYHSTDLFGLIGILKDNSIKLAFGRGSNAEEPSMKDKHFYLSMSRQKVGNYARGTTSSDKLYPDIIHIVLHMDAKALSHNYKIHSVDYWQWGRDKSEQEDRLISDKQKIGPATRYIKSINIYVPKKGIQNEKQKSYLHKIDRFAKKRQIPTFYYDDVNYFMQLRHSGATKDINDLVPKAKFGPDDLDKNYMRLVRGRKKEYYTDELIRIYNGAPAKNEKNYERMMTYLKYYPHDAYGQISTEIHNAKRDHPEILQHLVQAMKETNSKNLKEFITYMIDFVRKDSNQT